MNGSSLTHSIDRSWVWTRHLTASIVVVQCLQHNRSESTVSHFTRFIQQPFSQSSPTKFNNKNVTRLARRAVSAARPPTCQADGAPTVHAPGGRPARLPAAFPRSWQLAALQTTTDDSQQNNTSPLGGPSNKSAS